jgi:hypothetical protein
MPVSTPTHVRRFLNVADEDTAALDLMRSIVRSAVRSRAGWKTLRSLEEWTSEQLKLLDVEADQALSSADVLDVFAAVRLVTRRAPARPRPRSARQLRFAIAAVLDTLEPDFIPELLKQTRQRVASDDTFAAELAESRAEIERLIPRVAALREDELAAAPTTLTEDSGAPVVLLTGVEVFVVIVLTAILLAPIVVNAISVDKDDPPNGGEGEEGGGDGESPA